MLKRSKRKERDVPILFLSLEFCSLGIVWFLYLVYWNFYQLRNSCSIVREVNHVHWRNMKKKEESIDTFRKIPQIKETVL